jgi:hypothetical protein
MGCPTSYRSSSAFPSPASELSGVPSEVLSVMVSLICRLTFDFAVWSETQVPITIICEEAHRYAPRNGHRRTGERWKWPGAAPRRLAGRL